MQDALRIYFDGEKYAGLLLAGLASALLLAAVVIFRAGHRSFGWTLGALALIQIALGIGLYLRSGPQAGRLAAQLQTDAAGYSSAEGARMARVQKTFVVVEYAEVLLIVACALIALTQKHRPALTGVALGLLVSASILLAFDLLAERRGAAYLEAIRSLRT
jgi:hypothetical protein